MKNWNLLKLNIELFFRWIALVFGFGASLINIFIYVKFFNLLNELNIDSVNIEKINDPFSFINPILIWMQFPVVISTFILVATRKFKELNQLIEENKKL